MHKTRFGGTTVAKEEMGGDQKTDIRRHGNESQTDKERARGQEKKK